MSQGFMAWLFVQGLAGVSTLTNFGMAFSRSYILEHLSYHLVCSIERTSVARQRTLLFRTAQARPKTEGLNTAFRGF